MPRRLEDAEGCPLYLGAVIRGVTVGPSPAGCASASRRPACARSTTWWTSPTTCCYELGQPLHAFDLATLAGQTIVVRRARAGEKMVTLDGVERALSAEMTMIADASAA